LTDEKTDFDKTPLTHYADQYKRIRALPEHLVRLVATCMDLLTV